MNVLCLQFPFVTRHHFPIQLPSFHIQAPEMSLSRSAIFMACDIGGISRGGGDKKKTGEKGWRKLKDK